jgi:hypothetical protein
MKSPLWKKQHCAPWLHAPFNHNRYVFQINEGNEFEELKKSVLACKVAWSLLQPNPVDHENLIKCHMVFYVTMVTFWMTLLMDNFTNTIMDDG